MLIISLLVFATSLLMSLSASTAVASSDSLSSGISSTLVPSPSSSFIVTTVRTQDFSMVSLSITQTSSVWPSDIHMSSSTSVASTGTSSRILIRPATSSLNVKASASSASLLMSLSASTAVASSDSLSSGISSTLVPSPSSSFIVTTVRTQDFSMVSLSITQTSSVWPSDIHMSSSTSVSSTGTSSRILIRPATSSLNVKASASPGVNPCGKNNGGCAHYCVRYGSDYNCSCATGFQLESDHHNCRDIDECNSTSGEQKCAHICVNTEGSFACACRTGYKLENDGLACKKVAKTSPTDAAKSDDLEWDWLVLGIVIGAVAFAILCLILGIISKKVTGNQSKENINTQEMTAVKTTSSMAATNPGAIES